MQHWRIHGTISPRDAVSYRLCMMLRAQRRRQWGLSSGNHQALRSARVEHAPLLTARVVSRKHACKLREQGISTTTARGLSAVGRELLSKQLSGTSSSRDLAGLDWRACPLHRERPLTKPATAAGHDVHCFDCEMVPSSALAISARLPPATVLSGAFVRCV